MDADSSHSGSSPQAPEPRGSGRPVGLPPGWGREKLVAVPRDASRVWLYWELSPAKLAEVTQTAPKAKPELHLIHAETRKPAGDSACVLEAGAAWIHALGGETYYAELGLAGFGRPFTVLLRSDPFRLPWGAELHERTRSTLELPERLRRFEPPRP